MLRSTRRIAALIVVALAGLARADIAVLWVGSSGFYANGTAGNFPTDGINNFNGGHTLAVLVWSPDNVIGPVDPGNPGGLYVGGNDMALNSLSVTSPPSTSFADYAGTVQVYSNATYGQILEGGFVYLRIFEDATPAIGEYYLDSSLVLATVFTGTQPPQSIEHNTDLFNGNELNSVIVPEPATCILAGIGLLLPVLRRKIRAHVSA